MSKSFEKFIQENPLYLFSLYTGSQIDTLDYLANRIHSLLGVGIKDQQVDAKYFKEVYGLFWLWVLGAFQVVWRMHASRSCFSDRIRPSIKKLKEKLNSIREPFAKQEYAGRSAPISGESSISNIDMEKKDMAFHIEKETFWVRELLNEFHEVISNISAQDILSSYKEHKSTKSNKSLK
ncbi:MAG: hypothetical protein ACYC1T_00620 [Sulfuricaulis sp.]